MIHFLTRKVLSWLGKRRTPKIAIATNDTSITLGDGTEDSVAIAWEDVKHVVAFKRDVYAHDMICVAIERLSGGVVEVNESMPGWQELVHAMGTCLPGAKPYAEWVLQVSFPAFELTPVDIFKR